LLIHVCSRLCFLHIDILLGDLDVDGRITLKLSHKNKLEGVDWIEMAAKRDFYEHSSETWGSIKGEKFLNQLSNLRKRLLHKVTGN
jgi:hypothetical protein